MKKRLYRLVLCMMGLLFALASCSKQEEVSTEQPVIEQDQSFKIQNCKLFESGDTTVAENITFLLNEINSEFAVNLEMCSTKEKNTICLVSTEAAAKELGYDLGEWNENTFILFNKDDVVYLVSPSDGGIKRAGTYFLSNYVAEDGSILLENKEKYVDWGKRIKEEIYIGDKAIDEYTIVFNSEAAVPACKELQYYIQQTSNDILNVASAENATGLLLKVSLDETLSVEKNISVEEGQVCISAKDINALYDAVYLFADTYLGWIKAGEKEASISAKTSQIHVPANVVTKEAWIEEREAIICLWNVNYTRGAYLDADISLKNNIIDFSEEQLYDYVKMLKYCGFTGI